MPEMPCLWTLRQRLPDQQRGCAGKGGWRSIAHDKRASMEDNEQLDKPAETF
jgi:hypothetical protein